MKNGIQLPQCQIKLSDNKLPTNSQKAEVFADMFAKTNRLEGLSTNCQTVLEL